MPRARPSTTTLAITLAACIGLLASPVTALTPALLIRPDLTEEPIHLIGLTPDGLSYFDKQRIQRVEPISRFVQLRDIGGPPNPTTPTTNHTEPDPTQLNQPRKTPPTTPPDATQPLPVLLELTDGQVLVGYWPTPTSQQPITQTNQASEQVNQPNNQEAVGEAAEERLGQTQHSQDWDDAVTIQLPDLGRAVVPLTYIRSLRWTARSQTPAAVTDRQTTDTVHLVNGDQLDGFIETLQHNSLTLFPEGDGPPITLALDRVAELALANPDRSIAPGDRVVTLTDGSRLAAGSVRWDGQTLTLNDPRWTEPNLTPQTPLSISQTGFTTPAQRLTRIDLGGDGLVLKRLADIPFTNIRQGQAFGVNFPSTVKQGDLLLHAPAQLAFKLPQATTRAAATVTLDLPASLPERQRRLAHCTLTITFGPNPDQNTTLTLSYDQPQARFNVPIQDDTLELTADTGNFGPILDRIRLQNAVLLHQAE